MKLWERFVTLRTDFSERDVSFDSFWYDFLLKCMVFNEPRKEIIYNEICAVMEKHRSSFRKQTN